MDDENAKAFKNIEKNGCHIVHVTEDENRPCFTYSVGMQQSTGNPELIITGLEKDIAHFLINEYNYRLKDGETFEADKYYDDFLEGFQITFKQIEKKHYKQYFEYGLEFYKGDNFSALHLIWPSTDGTWPWEKKATKDYRYYMPRLYKS